MTNGVLTLPREAANDYLASVLSDFIRRKLIAAKRSFTFETVMSSSDKVELLDQAKSKGFRNYLYYIATEDPAINVSRVQNRVGLGATPCRKTRSLPAIGARSICSRRQLTRIVAINTRNQS